MTNPDDHETHWHAPAPDPLRQRAIRIGLALFALAVFGGVWASGSERGWW